MKQYDYLLVGSGLFAGVFAYFAGKQGKKCLVLEKRDHLGGNIYCEETEGIHVHKYGAHIFHTSSREVWDFVNSLAGFNRYTNSPVANYKGEMYNMPFNMNTFSRMWGISTPEEAKKIIQEQRKVIKGEPKNLEEQAISLVGTHIYQKLVKGYTEKQWGRECKDLPAFIIKRLPVRYTYDNNYFNDLYQGIPMGGYNVIIDKLFAGCEVRLGTVSYTHLKRGGKEGGGPDRRRASRERRKKGDSSKNAWNAGECAGGDSDGGRSGRRGGGRSAVPGRLSLGKYGLWDPNRPD